MALHAYTPPLHAVKTGQPRLIFVLQVVYNLAKLIENYVISKSFAAYFDYIIKIERKNLVDCLKIRNFVLIFYSLI